MNRSLVVIGIGGVGSQVAFNITQWNAFAKAFSKVYLIDGDTVERKNLERQKFGDAHLGLNKAEAVYDQIADAGFLTSDCEIIVIPEYINSAKLHELIDDSDQIHLVSAVDNDKTKAEINNWFNEIPNVVGWMAGNEYSDGTVAAAVRKEGKPLTPDFSYMQGEGEDNNILNPQDKSPDELSCAEEAPSSPQLIWANQGAAFFTCAAIYSYIEGDMPEIPFRMLYFDVKNLGMAARSYPKDAIEALQT